MFDFLLQDSTFAEYPVQTCIHWLQGLLVGALLAHAHHRREPHLWGYAFVATICFICYEGFEQWRIADRGDVDLLNFMVMVHLSAGITLIYHSIRRKYREHRTHH